MKFVLDSVKNDDLDIKGDANEFFKTLPVVNSTNE